MMLIPRLLMRSLLRVYKGLISPLLPSSCRFTPSCSEYAMEAVERHGVLIGSLLSTWRILRCNPFSRGGLDTVPTSFRANVAQPPSAVVLEFPRMHNHSLIFSGKHNCQK